MFLPFCFSSPAPFLLFIYIFFVIQTCHVVCVLHWGFSQFRHIHGILPTFLSCIFLEELFFLPQRIIDHLYYYWHMKILNHCVLFVSFLLVVGSHSPRPISCVFMQMSVMKGSAWEHQRGNSSSPRATMANSFQQKINARKQIERNQIQGCYQRKKGWE